MSPARRGFHDCGRSEPNVSRGLQIFHCVFDCRRRIVHCLSGERSITRPHLRCIDIAQMLTSRRCSHPHQTSPASLRQNPGPVRQQSTLHPPRSSNRLTMMRGECARSHGPQRNHNQFHTVGWPWGGATSSGKTPDSGEFEPNGLRLPKFRQRIMRQWNSLSFLSKFLQTQPTSREESFTISHVGWIKQSPVEVTFDSHR